MPAILNGQTAWAVVILALAVACSVLTITVIWNFAQRRARLPDATRYEDLKERAATIEVHLSEQEDQLRELNQRIYDRDRTAAEIAALTERRDNLRAEFAALGGAEQQIDAMKQRAAEAAGAFAVETGKLEEVKLALQEAAAHVAEAQEHLDRLKKDADELEARNRLSRETLPSEIEKLRATLDELATQKDSLDLEISNLEGIRESLFAARAETAALAARSEAVNQEIELARRTRDDLLNGRDLADARQKLAQIGDEVATLRAERASLEQMATRAALETEIARLHREASSTGIGNPDGTMIAADLAQLPGCLCAVSSGQHGTQLEDQALFDVEQHLSSTLAIFGNERGPLVGWRSGWT